MLQSWWLCISGRTLWPYPSPFHTSTGESAFLYQTPKSGAAPLAKEVETTRCSTVAFGVDFARGIIAVWDEAFLERRSQLDVPNICTMAVHLHGPLCSGRACSSNFSFPLAMLTMAPSSPAAHIKLMNTSAVSNDLEVSPWSSQVVVHLLPLLEQDVKPRLEQHMGLGRASPACSSYWL